MSTYPNMHEISMLETFGMEARALINQLDESVSSNESFTRRYY